MRNNQPVTNVEQHFDANASIVSKTDTGGRIRYVNRTFVEVSGFTEDELIGQPHNIVRHPDMPAAAFEDFWRTLKAGQAWQGLVKNRCKNGDYYWVEANANPIRDGDQVVGYMSLRTRPSRAQVDYAERVYRELREGSSRYRLQQGRIVRRGPAGWPERLRHASLHTRLLATTATLAALLMMLTTLSLATGLYTQSAMAPLLQPDLFEAPALQQAQQQLATVHQSNRSRLLAIGLLGLLALLGTLAAGVLLLRAVVAPLLQATRIAEGISSGNLSQHIDVRRRDESGRLLQALKNTLGNLRGIVGDVRAHAEAVGGGVTQLAAGNSHLSDRTESQASALQETARAMDNFTATVQRNSEATSTAQQVAQQAEHAAAEGGGVVNQAAAAMADINEASEKIVRITNLIDDIALQTNLLSLNAAVEAARAGEEGRGFAVVAGEVRELAQRSKAAAKEIQGLVGNAVDRTRNGVELVNQSGETLGAILAQVREVSTLMREVAGAGQEQAGGIRQVAGTVADMDGMTQQNAALVQQAAGASRDMEAEARKLLGLMDFFRGARSSG